MISPQLITTLARASLVFKIRSSAMAKRRVLLAVTLFCTILSVKLEDDLTLNILFLRQPTIPKAEMLMIIKHIEEDVRRDFNFNKTPAFNVIDRPTCESADREHEYQPVKTISEMYCSANADVIIGPHCSADFLAAESLRVLKQLKAANMTNPEYLFIIPAGPGGIKGVTELSLEDQDAFNRVLLVAPSGLHWKLMAKFRKHLNDSGIVVEKQTAEHLMVHDAFYLYMSVATELYNNGLAHVLRDGLAVWDYLINRSFRGATGEVLLDSNADRFAYYIVETIIDARLQHFMDLNVRRQCLNKTCHAEGSQLVGDVKYSLVPKVVWGDYDKFITIPPDTPECGYTGEVCDNTVKYVIAVVILLAALSTVAGFYSYRRVQDLAFYRMSWRVHGSDIKTAEQIGSMSSLSGMSSKAIGQQENTIFVGQKRAKLVDYNQLKTIVFGKSMLRMLKTLKSIDHDNLCEFVGICFNESNGNDEMFTLIWRKSHRGALSDIVFDTQYHLESMFQYSFMRDIINGLEYIHKSQIQAHGELTVENCEVDSHWTIKLNNFGVQPLLYHLCENKEIEYEQPSASQLLRFAPEILHSSCLDKPLKPSKEADIYSLGVLFYHILFRFEPFDDGLVLPEDILEHVIKDGANVVPQMPHSSEVNPDLQMVMKSCWSPEPSVRPQLREIKTVVLGLNPAKGTLVDQMIYMMERYAGNLEKLVRERTAALEEAQLKADKLLFRMLPRTVANQLKAGHTITPQIYKSATVFFSDIVQFTNLCAESTPIQIVNFLNQLFSEFDQVIEEHDSYKVETIGDAYLVVSGLPKTNNNRHARNIAEIGLSMSELAKNFAVPHLPNKKLAIRCGAHTGPVAAGVIGLITPRYCIFGDTVNTASRMESTGEEHKFQITESVHDLLQNSKAEFETVERGIINVKGKGNLKTFWLQRTSKLANDPIHGVESTT